MRPRLKVVFSWVLAAIGFFVGLCALTKFGMWWAPLGDHDQGWLLRWLIFVGIGLFGVGFLVGSLFAPRNPGRAGVIFLVFLAIYGVLPGLSGIAPQEASSVCVCSPHIDCCACMHAFSLDSGLSVAPCALLIPVSASWLFWRVHHLEHGAENLSRRRF